MNTSSHPPKTIRRGSPAFQLIRRHLQGPVTTVLLVCFSFWTLELRGATLTWDPDGVQGPPTGGNGTWNVASSVWDNAGTLQAWNNSNGDVALFNGTPGTVSLGTPISAGGLIFNAGGYTLSGSGANPLTLVGPGSIQVDLSASPTTLNNVIAGTVGFQKTGLGTLVLGGTNTFSGPATLSQGTLVLAGLGALGSSSNVLNLNGGSLQTSVVGGLTLGSALANLVVLGGSNVTISGSQPIDFAGGLTNSGGNRTLVNNLNGSVLLTISGGVNLSNDGTNRTLTLSGTGNTLINSVIIDGGTATAGSFVNNNSGTLTLTADNTFAGPAVLNTGNTVLTGAGGRLSATSGIVINPSATLTLDNSTGESTAFTRTNNRPIIMNGGILNLIGKAGGTSEVPGALSLGSGGSVISQSSASGSNSLQFNSLSFSAGSSLNLVMAGLGTTNSISFNTNAALTPTGTGIFPRVTVNGADFATSSGASLTGIATYSTYVRNLSAAGATDTVQVIASTSLTQQIAVRNALVLSGNNLQVGSVPGANLTLTAGGVINTGGSNRLAVSILNLGAVEGVFHTNGVGNTLDVTGSITGTAGLTKTLDGILQFSAPQYYTGTTTVNAGTLRMNSGLNAIYQNQPLALNGGTIDLNSLTQYVGTLTTGSATIVPNSGGSISSSTKGRTAS